MSSRTPRRARSTSSRRPVRQPCRARRQAGSRPCANGSRPCWRRYAPCGRWSRSSTVAQRRAEGTLQCAQSRQPRSAAGATGFTQVCNARASGVASVPLERIERAVRPDGAQRSALKELQDATSEAANLLSRIAPRIGRSPRLSACKRWSNGSMRCCARCKPCSRAREVLRLARRRAKRAFQSAQPRSGLRPLSHFWSAGKAREARDVTPPRCAPRERRNRRRAVRT